MLKSAEVEVKKEHQVLMVNKTTKFKKGKEKERELQEEWQASCHSREEAQKLDLSLKLSASTAKGMVTWSGTTPNTWRIRRMAKWTKVYLIYMLLMCTLLVFIVALGYLIPVQLLKISNSKQELQNKWRLVKGEVTMCVGSNSKVDKITIAHSLYLRD